MAPGMLEALVIASVVRPSALEALEQHYARNMPALLAEQLQHPLFAVDLRGLPRLLSALHALWAFVARAGVSCASALGAETPEKLLAARPTLGAFYRGCHFGA